MCIAQIVFLDKILTLKKLLNTLYRELQLSIRNYFGFTLREANGFIVLMCIVVVAIVSPVVYRTLLPVSPLPPQAEIELLNELSEKKKQYNATTKKQADITYFEFDPNTASEADLIKLGLNKYLVKRMIKFRESGGKFKVKKDLLRVYGFDTLKYEVLQAYINLPDSLESPMYTQNRKTFTERKTVYYELNTSDSVSLIRINGIGPATARRILKYRNKLGGFYSLAQLREVYGLDTSNINSFEKYLLPPDTNQIVKLNINTADFDALQAHPYIRKFLAKLIVAYREQHGDYQTEADLLKIKPLTAEAYIKMRPYIKVKE